MASEAQAGVASPASPAGAEVSADDRLEAALAALAAQGVVHGIQIEAVREALAHPGRQVTVALGDPPSPGQQAELELAVALQPLFRLEEGPDGRVDYRAARQLPAVAEGDTVVWVRPPRPGTPGRNVLGEPVSPPPVPDVVLTAGSGVRLEDDGRRAVATRAGRPEVRGAHRVLVRVVPVLEHQGDVNLSTGHLVFPGVLVVRGGVARGMEVRSRESVTIHGSVEGALVTAGGSLVVQGMAVQSRLVAGACRALTRDWRQHLMNVSARLQELARVADAALAREELARRLTVVLRQARTRLWPDWREDVAALEAAVAEARRQHCQGADWERFTVRLQALLASETPDLRELVALTQEAQAALAESEEEPEEGAALAVGGLQECQVAAAGDVTVGPRGAYRSEVVCGGSLTAHGPLRGGVYQAEGDVTAKEAGAGSTVTELAVPAGRHIRVQRVSGPLRLRVGQRSREWDREADGLHARLGDDGEIALW